MHSIAPREEQLRHKYIQAAEWLESSFAEEDIWVLADQDDHR